jgi:hypothetical protein
VAATRVVKAGTFSLRAARPCAKAMTSVADIFPVFWRERLFRKFGSISKDKSASGK